MKNGLTVSAIFEASSLNYGEGMGNIATLKHITRAGGNQYTYVSRQALRYSMIEQMGCGNTPVEANGSGEKKVIQFAPDTDIKDYPEIDLFGYMKTSKGDNATTRSAVVRLTNAVSLEPFHSDLDFLTNMGLARRADENNSIAQSEIHKSLYSYTITIDLDRIGVDHNTGTQLEQSEKARRVCDFLKTVEFLYRDIKGRRENLAPIFIAGGIYSRKSPFFENRLKVSKGYLNVAAVKDVMNAIGEETKIGCLPHFFANDSEIQEQLHPLSVSEFFRQLCAEVEQNYDR